MSLVDLGLEHSCLWPRECLSTEGLFLALASDFFVYVLGLGLEPCVLDSTSAIEQYDNWLEFFCRSVSLSQSISERSVVVKFRRWIGVSVRLKNNRVEPDCKRYPQFFSKIKNFTDIVFLHYLKK